MAKTTRFFGSILMAFWAMAMAGCVFPAVQSNMVGRVVDRHGNPLPNAVVRVQASDLSTHTDAQGQFVLSGIRRKLPITLTAYASGYYIQAEPLAAPGIPITFTLTAHPTEDIPGYTWLSADHCAECHRVRTTDPFPLPFDEWAQDAHASAAINPRFLSMYNGTDLEGRQSPLTRYIDQRDYGRVPLPPDPAELYFGPGYKLDFPQSEGNCAACHLPAAAANAPYSTNPNAATGVGQEGITCDVCHKVWAVRRDPATGLPYPNMPGVLSIEFRRPPDNHQLFIGPLDDVAPGEDTFSALQNQSEFCAPCHYGVFWGVPVYNSFGEWLASPYADTGSGRGQTCQDCHMLASGADHFARFEVGGLRRDPEQLFGHRMSGGANETLLQNSAELQVIAIRDEGRIRITSIVTNTGAGHHLPTDSPLRQIFVAVDATDARGNRLTLHEGPVLPDWAGDLAGRPGVYFAKILEQLWTSISPTGAYWTPTRLVEDTRLPALAVNRTDYTFIPLDEGSITIEVRLIFRRAFYDLIQQKGWDMPDIVMETATITVPPKMAEKKD